MLLKIIIFFPRIFFPNSTSFKLSFALCHGILLPSVPEIAVFWATLSTIQYKILKSTVYEMIALKMFYYVFLQLPPNFLLYIMTALFHILNNAWFPASRQLVEPACACFGKKRQREKGRERERERDRER